MFWGPAKLHQALDQGRVRPFDGSRVKGASYQLSIGDEVYISPVAYRNNSVNCPMRKLKQNESFCIPSGQFAFILTHEHIEVERNEIAFISIRAKIKYLGIVNVSGFHVDPGFMGKLIFAVFNAGPDPVHLKQGQQIFLIWFSDLTDSCTHYRDPGPNELPCELVNGISGNLYSLTGLAERLEEVESQMIAFRAISLVLITLSATLLLTLIGIIVKTLWFP